MCSAELCVLRDLFADKLEYDNDFNNVLVPAIRECTSEMGYTEDDLDTARKNQQLDDCMFICVFHKMGLMKDDKMDLDETYALTEKFFKPDTDKEDIRKVSVDCYKVSDAKSENDKKCCDRARLIFDCLKDNIM
uniref:Odorant binding protein n=1 Tax=Dendrolimus kikuchii TaxID=765133 RepID=A0A076E7D1_9NEOP|nr:odorant binding protein [Dendrolimus kikuchii]